MQCDKLYLLHDSLVSFLCLLAGGFSSPSSLSGGFFSLSLVGGFSSSSLTQSEQLTHRLLRDDHQLDWVPSGGHQTLNSEMMGMAKERTFQKQQVASPAHSKAATSGGSQHTSCHGKFGASKGSGRQRAQRGDANLEYMDEEERVEAALRREIKPHFTRCCMFRKLKNNIAQMSCHQKSCWGNSSCL